ncbi:hypothetical protein [Altererythrobacter sp. MF3-039]|uniref:hypothetical protein n=1 Tax=Altererythrobacter sp. MF3-039 TaxID=3252901 RepID=UPI00390C5F73
MVESSGTPDFPDMDKSALSLRHAREAIALLSSGGDARIAIDSDTGLNRYLSAPYPRQTLAYASSTANDLSGAAFEHACRRIGQGLPCYEEALDSIRQQITDAYGLDASQSVVFAASGTDLEYVALAAIYDRAEAGVHNVLLGADEVGSGCPFSAAGKYFAEQTSLGIETVKGEPVPGLEHVSLADIAVRCEQGRALASAQISAAIETELELARSMRQHALVHVVHGSKTGLILPDMAHLDYLKAKWGSQLTFVVDACQARITPQAVRDYLDRGAIVFVTGSKFMGGAPFSGFALIPPAIMEEVITLQEGLRGIFRRGEWPSCWPGRDALNNSENPGLALRLDAAVFELQRFQQLTLPQVERVIVAFEASLKARLLDAHDMSLVKPYALGAREEAVTHPIEMRTLATLDVSRLSGLRTFDECQDFHRRMALAGVRLGQPVKCVHLDDGRWGGTLRIGLSMPQIVEFSALEDAELKARFDSDMQRLANALVTEYAE